MSRFNAVILIIILVCLGISITSGIVISPVCTEPGFQKNPAISGEIIVWQSSSEPDLNEYDIYLWDPEGGVQPVCTEDGDQRNAAISGDTIVWQDKRNFETTGWDIYLWDPLGGEQPVCTDEGNQMVSDISGDTIVWKEEGDIYKLVLGGSRELVRENAGDTLPVIDGNTIVWQDARNMATTGWDIYLWDPVGGEQSVCTDMGNQILPAISGDTVVWQDNRSYETTGWDLYKKDLGPGGSVQPVCTEPGDQLHAKISGDTIVWTDYRNGEINGYDIYMWDPVEGEQSLCTEPGFQGEPDISGDIVVWEDDQTESPSGYDIYMAYLSKTPPVANAGPDQTVLEGAEVGFDGGGSSDPDGTIVTYSWEFGDGSSGTGTTVTHVYPAPGSYTAMLTVTDNDTLTDYDTAIITVQAPPLADAGPDQTVIVGAEVGFDGSGSSDPDGTIVTYFWEFGDGLSSTGMTVTHVYPAAGTYSAILTVTDNDILTDYDTAIITVQAPPVADAGPDQTVLVGAEVGFDGSGSSDPDGTIVTYSWEFGDGSSGSGTTVTHIYPAAGTYSAILTVTDNDGLKDTDTTVITVQTPQDGMEDLIVYVESLELPPDIKTGLTDKLDAAIASVTRGNDHAAINQLNALINQVNGLVGSMFSREEADQLINAAQDIIAAIRYSSD